MKKIFHRPCLIISLVTLCVCLPLLMLCGQATAPPPPGFKTQAASQLKTGEEIFKAACVACHGPDGKGTPEAVAGFERPDTFPDFADCPTTTPETNVSWRATITNGGPPRGFSSIMPAFGEALTAEQIDKVVGYLRTLCTNPRWPRGELNLPRALNTDKAFPESENVFTSTINGSGAPGFEMEAIHERRFGMKNQIEIGVPFAFANQNHSWTGGVGDIVFGAKRVLYSDLRRGNIFSVQGEVSAPVGSYAKGFGAGTPVFGLFGAYGQVLPRNTFLQFQSGADLPVDTKKSAQLVFWNTAVGKTFAQNHGHGRLWSPMVEFLGERELVSSALTNWDMVPQMQVTLNKRQHIRGSLGVRFPMNNTSTRGPQVQFYLLWDFADGKLLEGW